MTLFDSVPSMFGLDSSLPLDPRPLYTDSRINLFQVQKFVYVFGALLSLFRRLVTPSLTLGIEREKMMDEKKNDKIRDKPTWICAK